MQRFKSVQQVFSQSPAYILAPLYNPMPIEASFFIVVLLFSYYDDSSLYKKTIANHEDKMQNKREILQKFESIIAAWMPITSISATQVSLDFGLLCFAVFFLLKIVAGYCHYRKRGPLDWRGYRYTYFLIVPCAIPLTYLCGFDPLTSVWVIALITATQSAMWWQEGWVRK